jgi:hypothetical protein
LQRAAGTSETAAAGTPAQRGSTPDREHGLLQKVDSSKDFLASHLMRVSVINPIEGEHGGGADDAPNGAAVQPTGKQAAGAEEDDEDEAGHRAGGMGCTAVSLLYRDGEVVVANTGGPRITRGGVEGCPCVRWLGWPAQLRRAAFQGAMQCAC